MEILIPLTQTSATTKSSCGIFRNILQISLLEFAESNTAHPSIFMTSFIIIIAIVSFPYIFARNYLPHF